MAVLHPARARGGMLRTPAESLSSVPAVRGGACRRAAGRGISIVLGVLLGVSVADMGAAILRSLLLVAVLVSVVVMTTRRLRAR